MTTTTHAPIVRPVTPAFVASHPTHTTDDVTGYDVIRSDVPTPGGPVRLTVTDVIRGANRYADAMTAARAHRTPAGPGSPWGYTATRYACGCRWIATILGADRSIGDGSAPAPVFVDHPDA